MTWKNFTVEVIKTNRKSIQIKLIDEKSIQVRAPKRANETYVFDVLEKHALWIEKNSEKLKLHSMKQPIYRVEEGCQWDLLGSTYLLNIQKAEHYSRPLAKIKDQNIILYTNTDDEMVNFNAIMALYKLMLKPVIEQLVTTYQGQMAVEAANVTIKRQKTLWGSCSSKRNLNFNVMVAFADMDVITYLVVHEMCHLKHMNHSIKFWHMVEDYMPGYEKQKQWLRENGHLLRHKRNL